MRQSTKIIATVGLIGKGSVYFLTGVLTLLAALNLGGEKSGKSQAFDFLDKYTFGSVLLAAISLSLLCYVLWLLVQCFSDPENTGSDFKALAMRAGSFFSSFFYLFLAFLAAKSIFSTSSGGSGKSLHILGSTLLTIFFAIGGVSLAGSAISFLVQAYKGTFLEKFEVNNSLKLKKLMIGLGYFGLYTRFAVIGIMSYVFFKITFGKGTKNMKGTKEAFSFLQEWEYGTILMTVAAAGLVAYGTFIILLARYRKFDD